jgi:DNA-binding CsgD family transcriptional regulator
VLDPDSLVRLLVAPAVLALGFADVVFAPGDGPPAAVFVGLDSLSDCRAARRVVAGAGSAGPLIAGYSTGPAALLAAHRAHRCCDLVLRLKAVSDRPRLEHLAPGDPVEAAGLSDREADVLVLLLRGLTTPSIAAQLCIAGSTARSHCRSVLRKLGAPDRRALCATLLGAPPACALHPSRRPFEAPFALEPQICRASSASFVEESPVAMRPGALHT